MSSTENSLSTMLFYEDNEVDGAFLILGSSLLCVKNLTWDFYSSLEETFVFSDVCSYKQKLKTNMQ